jgi:DNA-binding CsgD family transcriptional regulator
LLEGFLGSIEDGFAVLALEGEPGIGKTTLWREGMRAARARASLVLTCRPAQAEARLSFVGLIDLLGPVADQVLGGLPEPQRRVLEVALVRSRGDGLRADRTTISVAFLSALRLLVASGPVLVGVDDAQWLDRSSAAVLEFALRRLEREPVRVLTSIRLSEEPIETFDRAAGERRGVLRIGPLSVAALHEVIKERLGVVLARPTLIKLARLSAGNPFYALEVARAVRDNGEPRAGEPLPVPDDLGKLVRGRIRRLPAESRHALLVASALAAPRLELIDREALAAAEGAEIVRVTGDGRVEFTHPLFASAVYSSAPARSRRQVHARLAELVQEVEERARHLALAADRPDEAVAEALERGALEARSRGAWESAAELLEQARELTPAADAERRAARGLAAAEDHIRAGGRPRARALFDELLDEPLPRAVRSDALRLLAQTSYHDRSFAEAKRLFAEALACASGDPRREVAIEFGLVFIDSELLDFASASAHAYRAAELAELVDDPPLRGMALADCAMMDFFCGRGVDWEKVTRSLELEGPHPLVPLVRCPTMIAGLLMLFVGRLSEARERLLTVWERCDQQGEENDLAFIVLWLAWLETHRADFVAAKQLVDQGATLADLTGAGTMHGWALSQRAYLFALAGKVAAARRSCEEALELSQRYGYAVPMVWVAAAHATLELSRGDAEAAWRACELLTSGLEYAGIGEPTTVFFLPDALEALIALGQLDRAETLLDAFEGRSRELDRAWTLATGARCRGMLLAARGDLTAAEAAFDRALSEHDRVEMPFERGRTLLCLGRVKRRAKQRKAARETLGGALEIFERVRASLWAERARQELARTHVREAPLELSPSEAQVVQLAAQGLKNREIAERLFLSPKTVEANLARAYRKLGVRSRAELGAAMAKQVASRSS